MVWRNEVSGLGLVGGSLTVKLALLCLCLPWPVQAQAQKPLHVEAPISAFGQTVSGGQTITLADAQAPVATPATLADLLRQIDDHYALAQSLARQARAEALASVRTLLDQLAQDYQASDEAVSLALGQKVGTVDPVALDGDLAALAATDQLAPMTPGDATAAALSPCFTRPDLPALPDGLTAEITIHRELDADGELTGMPDLVAPAQPDAGARKLFQRSLAAFNGCAAFQSLALPAALEITLTAAGLQTATILPGVGVKDAPVAPPPAPQVQALAPAKPDWPLSTSKTEAALGLKRPYIAQLQQRLGLLGFDANGVDGVLGRGVRAAIARWQFARSAPPSGYLDDRQYAAVKAESETAFAAWIAQKQNSDLLARVSNPPKPAASTKGQARKSFGARKWFRDERGWYCTPTFLGPMCQNYPPTR